MSFFVYFTAPLCLDQKLIVTKLLIKKRCILIKTNLLSLRSFIQIPAKVAAKS